jgi:hypothetical protein
MLGDSISEVPLGIPKLQIRPGNPDFLDLPWGEPISRWDHHRLVTMPTGVHRHPVVFVAYEEGVYAIKEMPLRLARREFEVLVSLEERTHRAANPAGFIERTWLDTNEESAGAVITKFVEYAFPYRRLVSGPGFGARRAQMLDAVAGLLVELHLAGCYWGDCSLSNVLYRFDAGCIEAVMIDGETSELHPSLSDGQRLQDLQVMEENLAGEMSDIAAMNGHEVAEADLTLGEDVTRRYWALWTELNEPLVITRDESFRIRERIARVNSLGYSVHDIMIEPTADGDVVRMTTQVGGRTHNTDKLRELSGIEASENQARLLLGDLNYFLARSGRLSATGKNVATFEWLTTSYEPIVARIREIWHGDDPVQGYCDFLHHRGSMAASRQADIPNEEAFESWITSGFPGFPLVAD